MYFGFSYVNARPPATANLNDTAQAGEDDEPSPPRNFTREQLSYFDGRLDEKSEECRPVYLSVNGMQPRFVCFNTRVGWCNQPFVSFFISIYTKLLS